MANPSLIYSDNPGGLPATYVFPPNMDTIVESSAVTVSGVGASEAFLLCLEVLTQDNKLIGRFFPPQAFAVGDSGIVTFAASAVSQAGVASAASLYEVVAAASTNAAVIKASPGSVKGWYAYNDTASTLYVKLYDKATTPTPATDTPKWVIALPPFSAANMTSDNGLSFSTGIGIATVTGISNTSNVAVAASSLVISIAYV